MSDIQDEAYSEACEEIERLKAQFEKAKKWNRITEIQIQNLQSIVEAQNQLIARAAEALEKWNLRGRFSHLINELRASLEQSTSEQ